MRRKYASLRKKRFVKRGSDIFISCFFSLLCMFLVSPKAWSQQVSVTLHAGNIPVNTALKRITAQTGIHFVYEAGLFDEKTPVTVQLHDASLEECLSQIFPGRKVVHTRVGTTVIIQSLADMEKLITGIVRNSKKEAIEAASIVSISTGDRRGVLSDADGSFRIRVPSATLLEVSYLGMQPYQFRADSGTHYEIILQESIQPVSEVVVMGMTSVDKRLFTGAADRFPAEDVLLSGVTEVSRSLEGRSAGVVVNNFSGTFGVSPKIRIRGATSLYGNSQPIWVIDGVIIEDVLEINADDLASGNAETILSSAVSGLNPDDIESFRILKDGAATSIYGGRAMAGVIVVTTKKGRPGDRQLNYTGEFSIRSKPLYGNRSLLNSHSQMEVFNEMVYNGWFSQSQMANETSYGLYGAMYKLYNGVNDDYLRQAAKRNTDWFDVLFSNSLVQQHSVSHSGGSGKSTQYASVSVMDDAGWGMQSKTSRVTAHLNYGHHIRHNLWANLMGTTSHRSQRAPGTLEQETDYRSGVIARSYDINPYQYAMNTSRMLDPDTHYRYRNADFSILEELSANYMRYKVADFSVQGQLKWEPLPAWELSALGAIRLQDTKTTHQVSSVSNMYRSYWQEEAPDGYDGVYSRNEAKVMSRDFRATATWNQSFAHGHTLHVFTGTEVRAIDRKYAGYTTEWADSGTDPAPDTYYRDVAFFASGTYSYNDTYIFNTTGRYEGTNRMGSSRRARWLPTWNLSGRWNMLSNLSTRVSYSLTADRGPNAAELSALSLIYNTSPKPYPELQQEGLLISTLENRDLTYEKKREWNVGLDMGFFQNRIRIGMDYYRRRNFDLIGMVTTQGVGGQGSKWLNFAAMRSYGYELSVSSANVVVPDFRWTTDVVFWTGRTKVTTLESDSYMLDLISGYGYIKEGYPVRSLFSIEYLGLDDGIPILDGYNEKEYTLFDTQQTDHLVYEGPTDPTGGGSLGNHFRWRNFSLNVYMTYSFGNKVRLNPVFSNKYTDYGSMPVGMSDRWNNTEGQHTDVPALLKYDGHESGSIPYTYMAYNYSTARVAGGGFVRLKDVSVIYDFPKRFTERWKPGHLSLKFQATNLCLLYADKKLHGQDPEYHHSGGISAPVPRQFTFTLKLGL